MIWFKRFFNSILLVLVLTFALGSSCVYARDEVDSVIFITENSVELTNICQTANNVAGSEILVYTANDGLLSFSNKKYSDLQMDVRKAFMETALLKTKESGMGSQVKNKTYNFIAEQDTTTSAAVKFLRSNASTDFARAAALFRPFGSAAGVVLGLLALGIFMFMGLSILIDIAYLSLPVFKVAMDADKNKRPRFVSREAYSSSIEAEESIKSGTYDSALGKYLRRRTSALIVMSIAVSYLISGKLYDFIAWLIDSFGWIF